MVILPECLETGSAGFMWENLKDDSLFSNVRLHVYYAHDMKTDTSWRGNQFVNHYNRIYYVVSGHAMLKFKHMELEMSPGNLYLIPPYTLDSHHATGDLHFYWAHFRALLDGNLDFITLFCKPEKLAAEQPDHIQDTFEKLVASVRQRSESQILFRNMLLTQLIQPFLERIDLRESRNRSAYMQFLPVLRIIENKLSSALSLNELSQELGVSPEHFSRRFKEEFNITPKRYILQKRLGLAKQLLLQRDINLSAIAARCGFCDQYHFSKTFKKEIRMTPSTYRDTFVYESAQ